MFIKSICCKTNEVPVIFKIKRNRNQQKWDSLHFSQNWDVWANTKLSSVPNFLLKCYKVETIFCGFKLGFLVNFTDLSRGGLATIPAKNSERGWLWLLLDSDQLQIVKKVFKSERMRQRVPRLGTHQFQTIHFLLGTSWHQLVIATKQIRTRVSTQ